MEDYKEFLEIDKDNLDQECVNQPVLYDEFASKVPETIFKMDIAKQDMDNFGAELYNNLAAEFIKSDGKKPTEKTLESLINLNAGFKRIQIAYYEAKKNAEQAKIMRESFLQRKEMIRGLIELHNSTYFSRVETKTDTGARESYDKLKLKNRKTK